MLIRGFATCLGLLVAAPLAIAGPVDVNVQDRYARVTLRPEEGSGQPTIWEDDGAEDFETFSTTIDRTLELPGETIRGVASHESSFSHSDKLFSTQATMTARRVATGSSGSSFVISEFLGGFTLDDTRAYSLTGSAGFVDSSAAGSKFVLALSGPDGFHEQFESADFTPGNDDGAMINVPLQISGLLTPGSYSITGFAAVIGAATPNDISASLQFTFNARAQDGPGTPIPLPAGVVPGAIMLITLAVAKWRGTQRGIPE